MWVYGDREEPVAVREALRRIAEEPDPAIAFVDAAGLAQGLADAAFAEAGADHVSAAQAGLAAWLRGHAARLAATWDRRPLPTPPPPLETNCEAVSVREAEGFAFYAVYPQAYLEAARSVAWPTPPLVIGLRSIGFGLAAMVAEGAGATALLSVRPTGPPFQRRLAVSDAFAQRLRSHAGPFAVVDEGPGLSGSSFAAALDLLQGLGVGLERIVVFPSHAGDLGPEANPANRRRWAAVRRVAVTAHELLRRRPLQALFADLIGPVDVVEDLSGGAWRADRPLPAFPRQERLKVRLTGGSGRWIARFAGLGRAGAEKFARARRLFEQAFIPEPLALREGWLLSRWAEGRAARPTVTEVGRYLAFRRAHLPAARPGASLRDLAEMLRANSAELGCEVRLTPPSTPVRPAHVDARLHAWEWIRTPQGRLLKLDALDHSAAHDLIGPQDSAWDVAGAVVELGFSTDEAERLRAAVGADGALTAFYAAAYCAFQAGLWTFAGAPDQVERYARQLFAASP